MRSAPTDPQAQHVRRVGVTRTRSPAGPSPYVHLSRAAGGPFCVTAGQRKVASGPVDLNADVGESFGRWQLGDDDALLAVVTSANCACGFHGGDPTTIVRTVHRAAVCGVTIGAQVSYPDLVGFGRRRIDVAPADLTADVLYQLAALDGISRAVSGSSVRYVKCHGALYHRTLDDEAQAAAVVEAVTMFDSGLAVLTMAGGALAAAASAAGLRVVREGYADRATLPDGRLVPRDQPGAVLDDPAAVARQAVTLAASGTVESICLHGDTPGAVDLATAVRHELVASGFELRAFA
jgi:5-oxoprolinase (ATP-hydrolysing) subunit A